MKYKMMPVIWVGDLKEAIEAQYGIHFEWDENLRNILFDDDYCNDCAKQLNIFDVEEYDPAFESYPWFNERNFRIKNLVKTYLQDVFPDQEYVMIDVMW